MSNTYLTTEQLANRIKYDARTIREQLVKLHPKLTHLA